MPSIDRMLSSDGCGVGKERLRNHGTDCHPNRLSGLDIYDSVRITLSSTPSVYPVDNAEGFP